LASGAVSLIVTASTLVTGVNLCGANHVAVWSSDFADVEVTHMTGRCG
jgi:hypothetical protein